MAGNNFTIPLLNPDFIGVSQAARNRNDQLYQNAYNNLIGSFNSIGQVGRDYSNRKFTEEEAEKQRQFQAAEAAKARQFQAAQHEKDLAAQSAWNNQVRSQEQAKLAAAEKATAQEQYANLIAGPDTPASRMMLGQLVKKYPDIDQYETGETVPLIFPNGGQPVKRSILEDTLAKRDADALEAKNVALYKSRIPTVFENPDAVAAQIEDINKQPFATNYKTDLVNYVNGIRTNEARRNDAVQGAVAGFVGKSTGESLEKQKAIKDALANPMPTTEQRKLLVAEGYHWDKNKRKYVK
jgi:hypothetical protein